MRLCCLPRRRTETQIQLDSEPPRPLNEHLYIYKLEELEKEEKLFTAHDLLEPINGYTIEQFIDARLIELLGCSLRELKDPCLADRICIAFFKKKSVIQDWRHESKLPLFEGLLLAFIFNQMRKLFIEIHEPQIAEMYEELRDEMDVNCTELLQTCFKKNDLETRKALEINYHKYIHEGDCADHRIRLMEIAYLGKANKFLAHPACQKAIDRRWQPSYRIGPTSLMLYVFYFCPILFFINKFEPYAKNPEDDLKTRVKKFYKSTSSKYVIHMVFRGFYVLIYSSTLIRLSGKSMMKEPIGDFWEEFFVMGWQCSYLVEMIAIMILHNWMTWIERNPVDAVRNLLIGINVVILILSIILIPFRYILLPIADLCFYLSYIMAVVRSMRILYVDSFFGSIVHMINKMVPIMIKFFLIFVFFWSAFAVCYISLSGHFNTDNSTYVSLPWQIFYHGAFEIFGEAIDDDKRGDILSCKNVDLTSLHTDSSLHCLFRTWMIPLLLFFYILISSILLVNILTDLLTKKYEDISKDYHIYWKVALYSRLAEYEDRPFVPAPLSIFYYIYLLIVKLATCLVKKICRPCKGPLPQQPPEAISLVIMDKTPPTPALARVNKPAPLATIEERQSCSSTDLQSLVQVPTKHFKRTPRPHSAHGFTEFNYHPLPTFSKMKDTEPPSPLEAVTAAIEIATDGMRSISIEEADQIRALEFIQNCRLDMVIKQNKRNSQKRFKQEVMESLLKKVEHYFAERPRGMTE